MATHNRTVNGALAAAAVLTCAMFYSAAAPPARFSSFDPQVRELLARMTLDEKIGQMTQADQQYIRDPAEVSGLALGSILSGGDSDPKPGNTLQAWTDLYDNLQQQALQSRLHIPILYGIDAVHGHNNVLGAVVFPHNIGLGCTRDPKLVREIARITAREVRATGIQWVFAPCVTVPQDVRWGRTYEGFSENPQLVAELSEAGVAGLQSDSLSNPFAVLACAKHFVGDGGTTFGSTRNGRGIDQGDTRVDEATLRRIHLPGYISAVRAGVGSIMPSYSSWNGVKVSGSKQLLTGLLKDELGFEGFLISDYNAIDQLDPDYKKAIAISINAGMDMAMVPQRYKLFLSNLHQLVEEGVVPMSRIDDAVTRILRVKFALGMFDSKRSQLADRDLHQEFGSGAHREIARKAVRESVVLLKNKGKLLPLSKKAARIHVSGKNADDLGNQCGGWTITWQGRSGAALPGGTTLLAAMRSAVGDKARITFSADGTGAEGADAAVVVIGERPYAEGNGDRATLTLAAEDLEVINRVKASGVPIAVVLYSGRPLILGDTLDQSDAFLAAWLPGTEGQGIADVLFGDYRPTGKLSFAWPRSMEQIASHSADLFPFGFGLTY